jgi:OmpA-OmpF porin, OOP family
MNKSKFAALLVGLAGLVAALPAAAQVSLYFGGTLGNGEMMEDACSGVSAGCDRSDRTWSGNLGFMFNPNWGVEGAYRDLGKVVEIRNSDGTTAEWKTKLAEFVVVGAIPVNKMTLYGKFGGYQAKTKLTSDYLANADSSNRQFTGAVGVAYDVFRHLRLRVEWQRYNNLGGPDVGIRSDMNIVTGGVFFVF